MGKHHIGGDTGVECVVEDDLEVRGSTLTISGGAEIVQIISSDNTSTKSPESTSEDAWLEVTKDGTTYFIPLYAAS